MTQNDEDDREERGSRLGGVRERSTQHVQQGKEQIHCTTPDGSLVFCS